MGILIGMDEAGYGPHLGPLVIAATAWEVSDDFAISTNGDRSAGKEQKRSPLASAATGNAAVKVRPRVRRKAHCDERVIDLYRLLRGVVSKSASERRMAIADSKVLYHPGHGLRQLERGLHAVLLAMQQSLSCWSAIVKYAGADPEEHHSRTCWPNGHDSPLPIDATAEEVGRLEVRFTRTCEAAGIRPLLIRARLVFPEQFNDLTAYYNSKGAALSHITVGLLRELVDAVCRNTMAGAPASPSAPNPQPPIYAVCDKHGGRNYYTALLQHHFSEYWIAPVFESHAESHYEWGEPGSRMRVVFRVNGERFLPTALASMMAKYLRELSMRAFNEFWRAQVPELRPTAGYYRDAWRFKKEIASKQRELGIDDHVLWRER
jgi:hypothetical protein